MTSPPTSNFASNASSESQHLRSLLALTIASRAISFLLLIVSSSYLPLFDSSPETSSLTRWSQPLLRWDAIHFMQMADKGYAYEHNWAFFPAIPFLMRNVGQALRFIFKSNKADSLLQGGALVALACDTSRTLYHLTLHHTESPSIAFLTSILSLMPSSPATLHYSVYNEPFFAYLSYKGMLLCARSQWFVASVVFGLAGTFRANGILSAGFIVWGTVIEPLLNGKKPSFKSLAYSLVLTSIVFAPFLYHHYSAYTIFCSGSEVPAEWCSNIPPSIYSHVQSKYWNQGFLHYWTVEQIPNFLISAPPLLFLFAFSAWHLRKGFIPRLLHIILPTVRSQKTILSSPFLSPAFTPHAIHTLFLCTTLLLSSHVQVILRLAASMPTTYWAASWLLIEYPWIGHLWVGWSIVWGAVSVVLWSAFLPPA